MRRVQNRRWSGSSGGKGNKQDARARSSSTFPATGDGQVTFQQVSTGKESVLPISQKLTPAAPPAAEPELVFDEVGNSEPSYTEYFTAYVLAEARLSGQDGYLIHTTRVAHKNRIVKGEATKK